MYLDPRSGRTWPLDPPRWRGEDGAPLMLAPLDGIGRDAIESDAPGLWRYAAALPFRPERPIALGEGWTPLVPARLHGADALVKCEWMNPTGSFKDRGASVMLSLLRAQGIGAVLEDSSGNGGAAIATYAAAGGLRATILAPASASPDKLVQTRAAGATLELVQGTRDDVAEAAAVPRDGWFYASHNWHPFFLQGTKTLAYELWEQLGFVAPDNVIVPCGAGSNVLGCGLGFNELLRAGEIGALPRIWAAQPANCAPVASTFLAGGDEAGTSPTAPTIAEGTAIARPVRLAEVLGVLRETRGGAVTASEAEIAAETLALARAGFYVEPTAATASVAFGKLLASGTIAAGQRSVVVLTGSGLKAGARIAELLASG